MAKSSFAACVIPSSWRRIRLDDLTPPDRRIVYGIVQAGPHVADGVPYIRSSDVGGRIRIDSLMRTAPEIAGRYRRSTVNAGDLIFSLRGNIGEMSIVPAELAGANLTQGTARISLGNGDSVEYVRYALQSPAVTRHIDKVSKGSTFREISIDQLRKVEIYLPPPPEQVAIARVLSFWDRAELHTESLLRAKRRLKRSLMKELLTGKRRFGTFVQSKGIQDTSVGVLPIDWKTARISNLFTQVRRKNENGHDRVLTVSGRQGLVNQREYFNRSVAGKSLAGYYLLRRGEFAYNRSTMKGHPFGAIKRLNRYEDGVLSTLYLCFALVSDEDQADSDFYSHFFESGLLNRQLRQIAQAGARSHGLLNVSAKDFFNLVVPVPPPGEQRVIARVLSAAEREIELLSELLATLKEQKRGLMQKLLTGAVRVPLGAGQADAGAET
jgi:type I restriction enzyme S subunit